MLEDEHGPLNNCGCKVYVSFFSITNADPLALGASPSHNSFHAF